MFSPSESVLWSEFAKRSNDVRVGAGGIETVVSNCALDDVSTNGSRLRQAGQHRNDDVGHDVGENVAATGCMEVMAAEKRQEKSPLSDQHSSKAAMACHTNCALATATVGAKAASYHAALQNDLPAIPIGPGQAVQPPTPPPRSARVEAYDIII